ncbi:TPA: hypothetical protein H1012_04045 [archaeon]|nr:hypothetical protein [Candidatus Naiadarchaeales archaeon SRR2090159.bin1288]
MDNKLLLLAIFTLVFLSIFVNYAQAQTVGNCTNYAHYDRNAAGNRTWVVTNATVCLLTNVTNVSNITIRNGGSLHLQEVNISFNGTSLNFSVESGGTLKIDNGSRIFSANGSNLGINFYYLAGSAGFINNSSISTLQNHSGSNGLNVNTSSFEFTNSTINNSLGYALNISGGSPTIKNSTFFNNTGGVILWNASPTMVNITIHTNNSASTDAGFNITDSTNASLSNISIFNYTFGIVFTNSNMTLNNITIDNSTYGIFAKSSSVLTLIDSFILNPRSISGYPNASSLYFNYSSNGSNITLLNPNFTNFTFGSNNTGNFSVKWYLDIYTAVNVTNAPVNEVSFNLSNGSNMIFAGVSNKSGTIQRINLTEAIFSFNVTHGGNLFTNYSNYTINASKGNSSASNSTILTRSLILGDNLTVQLNLSILDIQVNGSGYGAGNDVFVQNAAVTLTNGTLVFNETTNGTGGIRVYVPYGLYNVSVTQANFSARLAPSNSSIVNTSNATKVNVTMFMRINITGINNTAANGVHPIINKSCSSTGCSDVSSGVAFRYVGIALYAHNNSSISSINALNGSAYVASATSDFRSSSYNNLSTSGAFLITKTAAPSPTSTTNYTDLVVYAVDSLGNNGTAAEWLRVTAASTSVGNTVNTGTGGGAGGDTGDYSLTITEYTRQLVIAQSESKEVIVTAKNTGVKSLSSVQLTISGISSDWYKVNVTGGGTTKSLASGEAVTFNVKFAIPSNAASQTYKATWRARDKDALALAEKELNLTVSQVWTSERVKILDTSITDVEKLMANIWQNITTLKSGGIDTAELEKNFEALNSTLALSRIEFGSSDYSSAQNDLNRVKADIATLVQAIATAKPKSVGSILKSELVKPTGIIILAAIIGIAAAGGFFLWWKFLRVISIAEIRKNPDRFVQGARLQGVVKSITDTQKGKVFLLSDDAGEKIHVRYPYYTTC